MKKILVLSDSHGKKRALQACIEAEPEASAVIFLGDGAKDIEELYPLPAGRKLPLYIVNGNCDYDLPRPQEGLTAFEGTLIFYTHGHLYGVRGGPARLCETAAARGADIALYGHTHFAEVNEINGILACNPGSCGQPRGGKGAGYGLLTLERGEKPIFQIKPVPGKLREGLQSLKGLLHE